MRSKNKMLINKKITEDEMAVSAVVGVILMVAITVIMAAIVASWSSGIKAPTTPTTVGLDISRNDKNITLVVTTIDPPSAAPIPHLNVSYTWYNGTFYTNSTDKFIDDADVGNPLTMYTNSSVIKPLIVIATFKDGSKKVLYSKET